MVLEESVYFECTQDGHDKWWSLLKTKSGEWEAWYGKRGSIQSKSTTYSAQMAQKKVHEKLAKGYKVKGPVEKYSDLVAIQEYGWNKFVAEGKAPKKSKIKFEKSDFNFMDELSKV